MISIGNYIFACAVWFISLVILFYLKNKEVRFEKMIADKRVKEVKDNVELHIKLQKIEIDNLQSQLDRVSKECDRWKGLAASQSKVFSTMNKNSYGVSNEIIDAVKFAMKHAHPDNGGNSEDFIKFKHCYDELIKGR